jgi:hypothetical protein
MAPSFTVNGSLAVFLRVGSPVVDGDASLAITALASMNIELADDARAAVCLEESARLHRTASARLSHGIPAGLAI